MWKYLIISVVALLIINACEQSNDPTPIEPGDQEYTVKLNFGGEISFTDAPLDGRTHSSSDEVTYYAVQIRDLSGGIHASGLFQGIPSDLEVVLFKDRTYSAEVLALRKGTSFGIAVNNGEIDFQFRDLPITDSLSYNVGLPVSLTQVYAIGLYRDADSVSSTITSSSSSVAQEVDAYYGITDIDSLTLANDSIVSLRLIRNVSGYEVTVNNLQSGAIDITVGSLYNSFVGNDTTATRLFSYRNMTTDSSFYTTTYNVFVTHRDTVQGIPVNTTLFSDLNVPFKRLHKKLIQINAPADTTAGSNENNFGFDISLEDTPLLDGDTLVIN